MENTTSTEFIDWMFFMEKEEWHEQNRMEYYLAQIAVEIHNFRQAFGKDPKFLEPRDRLIRFGGGIWDDAAPAVATAAVTHTGTGRDESGNGGHYDESKSPKVIECGPEAVKDPKWARVNENAKLVWAVRMGRAKRAITEQAERIKKANNNDESSGT